MLEPTINKIIIQNTPQIKTTNKYLGEIFTSSKPKEYFPKDLTIFLKNKLDKTLGSEEITIEKNIGKAIGKMIWVEPEYQKKNFRFGEILRLSSIMMMLENKIKIFEIFSKNTAVFFHHKYKFEPAIKTFDERKKALEMIIKNCKNKAEYEDVYNEALKLQHRCLQETDAISQRNLRDKTNDLLKLYMKRISKKKDFKNHPFENGMWMTLTDEKIKENKNFFNELYEKHQIDYKI